MTEIYFLLPSGDIMKKISCSMQRGVPQPTEAFQHHYCVCNTEQYMQNVAYFAKRCGWKGLI